MNTNKILENNSIKIKTVILLAETKGMTKYQLPSK